MNFSNIQWIDSTINPVMGCKGCPLFPPVGILKKGLANALIAQGVRRCDADALIAELTRAMTQSEIYQRRLELAGTLAPKFELQKGAQNSLVKAITGNFSCYAAHLHLRHGSNPLKPDKHVNSGYAPYFEEPKLFAGRMAKAARMKSLLGVKRPEKPWLDGLPRLIFVSDMGDALSSSVPFKYLKEEIVDTVRTPEGARHLWLWLTKRPWRMAEFATYLHKTHGLEWPANLVAMTSVIDKKMAAQAIDHLRRVLAPIKALSVEPLWEPVTLNLRGIDWVIVGGQSGHHAKPFDLQWARSLRDQCRRQKVSFFLKQLGTNPVEDGAPVKLNHPHGG